VGDAGGGIEGGAGNQLDKVRACANKRVRTGALFSPEAALCTGIANGSSLNRNILIFLDIL